MDECNLLGRFKINDRDTEYTFWTDHTYRCNHWPEGQLSTWEIRSKGEKSGGPTLWVKHSEIEKWLCCDNSEMEHYSYLVRKIEELLVIRHLLTS
jgi:hypothetical protein